MENENQYKFQVKKKLMLFGGIFVVGIIIMVLLYLFG